MTPREPYYFLMYLFTRTIFNTILFCSHLLTLKLVRKDFVDPPSWEPILILIATPLSPLLKFFKSPFLDWVKVIVIYPFFKVFLTYQWWENRGIFQKMLFFKRMNDLNDFFWCCRQYNLKLNFSSSSYKNWSSVEIKTCETRDRELYCDFIASWMEHLSKMLIVLQIID